VYKLLEDTPQPLLEFPFPDTCCCCVLQAVAGGLNPACTLFRRGHRFLSYVAGALSNLLVWRASAVVCCRPMHF
jgi:hypothetical protein